MHACSQNALSSGNPWQLLSIQVQTVHHKLVSVDPIPVQARPAQFCNTEGSRHLFTVFSPLYLSDVCLLPEHVQLAVRLACIADPLMRWPYI